MRPMRTRCAVRTWWLALVTSLGLCQTSVPGLRKPQPDAGELPSRERLETLIEYRYPRLLTEKISGAAVLTVLFEPDGTLSGTDLEIVTHAAEPLTASEGQFARFGLTAGDLEYIGVAQVHLSLNTVLVVFGAKDTRQLDHAIVERLFPKTLTEGLAPGHGLWILFDHEGHVLRNGEESVTAATLRKTLEARYSGIRTQAITVTPVIGSAGGATKDSRVHLQLYCVWLAPDSPLPIGK